jgi:hypothetical protein
MEVVAECLSCRSCLGLFTKTTGGNKKYCGLGLQPKSVLCAFTQKVAIKIDSARIETDIGRVRKQSNR